MNNKFLSFVEKMGYKVDYSDNIDDIMIYENGESLVEITTENYKLFLGDNGLVFIFNKNGNNFIKVGIRNMIIIHDMNKVLKNKKHDYTNIIMDILGTDSEINFGININKNTGLSYIVVSVIDKTKNKTVSSIKFSQDVYNVPVYFNGKISTFSGIEIDDNIRFKIRNEIIYFLKRVFTSGYDEHIKKGIEAITPALDAYIDEIVSLWRKNLNKYINHYKDLKQGETKKENIDVLDIMIDQLEGKKSIK